MEIPMSAKTAKVFVNGGSQAVRLPAEFRFEGADEVYVRRDAVTGDVILSARPACDAWADFFAAREQAQLAGDLPGDFLAERPLNEPLHPRDMFEGR